MRSGVPRIGEKEMNFLDLENNVERHRFLENYREWGVWQTLPDLGLTFYRHKVDDYYIVAMEYRWEIPFSDDGRQAGVYFYRWKDGRPFVPNRVSENTLVYWLREKRKEAKKNATIDG